MLRDPFANPATAKSEGIAYFWRKLGDVFARQVNHERPAGDKDGA
jgi:hypothetical protein